jgi:hypothetical protein
VSETEAPVAKKGGGLLALAMPVVAGAAAFGLTYWAPWEGAATEQPPAAADDPHGEGAAHEGITTLEVYAADGASDGKSKPKKKAGKDGAGRAILTLEPMIVSLAGPEGVATRRTPRLRIALAVEGAGDVLLSGEAVTIKLRDGFTAIVRGFPPEALGAANGLEELRAALLAHARDVLGEESVSAILITDFLMT